MLVFFPVFSVVLHTRRPAIIADCSIGLHQVDEAQSPTDKTLAELCKYKVAQSADVVLSMATCQHQQQQSADKCHCCRAHGCTAKYPVTRYRIRYSARQKS